MCGINGFNWNNTSSIKTMNDTIDEGASFDDVLLSTIYIVGNMMAQRGIILDLDAPLKDTMSPLVAGYIAQRNEKLS